MFCGRLHDYFNLPLLYLYFKGTDKRTRSAELVLTTWVTADRGLKPLWIVGWVIPTTSMNC